MSIPSHYAESFEGEKPSPVFIVSSGRAGTTLLKVILNASEQIYFPQESDFIACAYQSYAKAKSFSEEDYRNIVSIIQIRSRNWEVDEDRLLEALIQKRPRNFRDLNCAIYDSYLSLKGIDIRRWGNKTVALIASIKKLHKVFPDAQFVHMVRDGRDVRTSYKKVHERHNRPFGPGGVLTAAFYWVDGVRRVKEVRNFEIYEIRYEDLIEQPEDEMKKLCSFLGIDFIQDMCSAYLETKLNADAILPRQRKQHKNIGRQILKNNKEKYKQEMTAGEIFLFELVSAPYLIACGYPLVNQILGKAYFDVIRRPGYALARVFNNCRYSLRYRTNIRKARSAASHRI